MVTSMGETVQEALQLTQAVAVTPHGHEVERTVARAWCELAGRAIPIVNAGVPAKPGDRTFRIATGPGDAQPPAMSFRLDADGTGELHASHPHWLYHAFSTVRADLPDLTLAQTAAGRTYTPAFPWMRNLSDFLVGSLRTARGFDPHAYVEQVAGQGFTHITVNALGVPRPFESGPPGDVYSWFYDYSPDLDQFVDSELLRGYYPPDYLSANLRALKERAAQARRYGLVPGLHVNSPRSMPEDFWNTYGFLRGARVDHPRETFRPRYTLAMAHPRVQEHYRVLVQKIMEEVPDLGFMHVWTNDSGSGFEFVSSLYAGRNGGPYLLREWKGHDEIARKAAANVLTYYRLLRDEARRVNPRFRVICDLGPFYDERRYIVPALGDGIDAGSFAFFSDPGDGSSREPALPPGTMVHRKLVICDNNLPGMPFPGLVYERLMEARREGSEAVLCGTTPHSVAPFDVNGEVVRSLQSSPEKPLGQILAATAERWAGTAHAQLLVTLWMGADEAVRNFPADVPMSTFGFPWFRLWVRPFVPDIDAVSPVERRYYEDFLLATFNNPARVDLNNDMMWDFLSVSQAGERKEIIDRKVLPPLDRALDRLARALATLGEHEPAVKVLADLHDRLLAARCYFTTMRNTMAWTESVHGYIEATTQSERERYRGMCCAMVENELGNTHRLLTLWNETDVDIIPLSAVSESLHIYGENFGRLLARKIALMERHREDQPRIDPEYMWRMKGEQ